MHTFIKTCFDALERLHKDLETAILGLPQEALDWVPGEGMNSITVLVSHSAGAERYWIGGFIGGVHLDRNRDEEFAQTGSSGEALITLLHETLAGHRSALENLTLSELDQVVESPAHGREFSKGWALIHMIDHTASHLGHVQVTRQLWEQENSTVNN